MSAKIENAHKAYKRELEIIKKRKARALQKWNDACLGEVAKISTLKGAEAAFKAAPWGAPVKCQILKVWARLCKTREEFESACRIAGSRFKYRHPVVQRWKAVVRKLVYLSDNPEKIVESLGFCKGMGYWDSRSEFELAQRAFYKWVEFYVTRQELEEAWNRQKCDKVFPIELYRNELDRREEKETGVKVRRFSPSGPFF